MQDINLEAMEQMSQFNEELARAGWLEKEREVLLVRLLLCFFAEDTGAFTGTSLFSYLDTTKYGPKRLSRRLDLLFRALAGNEIEMRISPEADLKAAEIDTEDVEVDPETMEDVQEAARFPEISRAVFYEEMPDRSLDMFFWLMFAQCQPISWGKLSPALFGAMFQEIMDQQERREWGTYYTSEENILRLVEPLFLEELRNERLACRGKRKKLLAFQEKLAGLHFMDPACGCGNFLILIYRELRRLELDVLRELYSSGQRVLDISWYCRVSVSQFIGMEREPFQAQIARIGLWLTERQMNLEASEVFGIAGTAGDWVKPVRIRQCNALTTDWGEVVSRDKLSYIVGNPPFLGARLMSVSQKMDMKSVFMGFRAAGNMDYVTAWYRKAAEFMSGTEIRAAFVSTNSICQGEQAALLWKQMKYDFNMSIDFAWRTFVWNNEAKNQAKVHCIIVGFSDDSAFRRGDQLKTCWLYSEKGRIMVPHINAYLSAAPDVFVESRRKAISPVPAMVFGSMANDNGFLILTREERKELVTSFPLTRKWIRPYLGSHEFINGDERYCLWLLGADPDEYSAVPFIAQRIAGVAAFRRLSGRDATRKLAETPELFGEIRQPSQGSYILVPRVSSMKRPYIPMGFVSSEWIASDAVLIIPGADKTIFAVLTSSMHMIWVKYIAGRLKSDFRYSASVVYNNFPFPELTETDKEELAKKAEKILDIRKRFEGVALSSLYDPSSMPEELLEAHRELDEQVEEIYGCRGWSEEEKIAELFRRYGEMVKEEGKKLR
ncbi:MAG: methylase [Clostridiales bacterium]|nr:methylase [Clostridiales bacterium]